VSAYLWGNLVGRLITSWVLVFVVALLVKKGRLKTRSASKRVALRLALHSLPVYAWPSRYGSAHPKLILE